MYRKFILIFFLTVVSHPINSPAQVIGERSQQVWLDINPAYHFSPTSKIYGEIGARKTLKNGHWLRLVFIPTFQTWLGGRFYLNAGIANFYTQNEVISDRYEFRPFQGITFNWPRWETPLNHYIRLEERFDFNTTTWESKNSLRMRYRLQFAYRWAAIQPGRFWQAGMSTEIFGTLSGAQGQFQEKARINTFLERSYTHNLHFRIEITLQQESWYFDPTQNISDIYFRLRLYRSWGNLERL